MDEFRIIVHGRQTHGAAPWAGVDPIVIGAQIVTALQTIQSRQVNVRDPSVLTVGTFQGGSRNNIIADRMQMTGTLRTYEERRRQFMQRRIQEIAENIARGMDGTAEVLWQPNGTAPLVNDPALTERMLPSLARVTGEGRLLLDPPRMAGDDFAYFVQQVPGLYFKVGTAPPGADLSRYPTNHSPRFQVDERALMIGLRATLHVVAVFTGS